MREIGQVIDPVCSECHGYTFDIAIAWLSPSRARPSFQWAIAPLLDRQLQKPPTVIPGFDLALARLFHGRLRAPCAAPGIPGEPVRALRPSPAADRNS